MMVSRTVIQARDGTYAAIQTMTLTFMFTFSPAMCYEGVSGLFKMFVSFFFIVCSSMLMISLRAGWQEDRTVDAPDDLYLTEETTNESTLFHDSTNPSEARLVVPGTQEQ
jgi:hypothetical protein